MGSIALSRAHGRAGSDLVERVIMAMPRDIDNVYVYADFIDVALALPGPAAVRLVSRIRGIANSSYMSLVQPDKFGALIAHLVNEGHGNTAFSLGRALLAPMGEGDNAEDTLLYDTVLDACLTHLPGPDIRRLFDVLCRRLAAVIRLSTSSDSVGEDVDVQEMQETFTDTTWVLRPAIEDDEQNVGGHDTDALISAVRDVARHLVDNGIMTVQDIVQLYKEKRWRVFQRLALHLLRAFPDHAPNLVVAYLADRSLFMDLEVRHEYALLLHDRYAHLPPDIQATILGWIDEGPAHPGLDARQWRRNWLSLVSEALTPERAKAYRDLVADVGPAQHPEFFIYMSELQGPTSPLADAELAAMGVGDIVAYITAWQPRRTMTGPSPDGLSVALQGRIARDPLPFASGAELFADLPLRYAYDLFCALRQTAMERSTFPWKPVLALCIQIVSASEDHENSPQDVSWSDIPIDRVQLLLAMLDLLTIGEGRL